MFIYKIFMLILPTLIDFIQSYSVLYLSIYLYIYYFEEAGCFDNCFQVMVEVDSVFTIYAKTTVCFELRY